ncbi:flagellar biosynthesis anti-sigma factor FlgM [Lachnospiraceae bacterium 62-35]
MNITFQTVSTAYRPQVTIQRRQAPKTGMVKGDYDRVDIRKPQAVQEDDISFARMLAHSTAMQISDGASPERLQELSSQIAEGTYQPDAHKIAGRLLGLG